MTCSHRDRNGRQTNCLGLAVVLSSLCLSGCAPTATVESPGTAEHEEQDHEHEHGIPTYKPKTFAAAVRQLSPRWKHISLELNAGHVEHADADLEELLEMIRWLPELAADTDLKKADWDRVQQLSTKLETLAVAHRSRSGVSNSRDIDTLVAELQQLAESTVPSVPESSHAAEDFVESDPQHSVK